MKAIEVYKVIANEDVEIFQKEFTEWVNKLQNQGYELDIKYSIAISKAGNLVNSVMILCY